MDDAIKFIYKQILIYGAKYTKPPKSLEDFSGEIDGVEIKKIAKILYYAVK